MTVNYHLKKYFGAELLRLILNNLELYLERGEAEAKRELDTKKTTAVSAKINTNENLRKLQILYFVSGSTVNSVCKI